MTFKIYYFLNNNLIVELVNKWRQMCRHILTQVDISIVLGDHVNIMEDNAIECVPFHNLLEARVHHETLIEPTIIDLFNNKHTVLNLLSL